MRLLPSLAALVIFGSSFPAFAQDAWQFRLTPYVWLAGLRGDVGTIPGQPAAPVDVSASDALRDLEGGGMILIDARKQRHGFLVDLLYTDVRSDTELLPSPIGLNLDSTSKTTIATVAYQYELFRNEQTVLDVLAGLRYWKVDTELRFSGGLGVLAGRGIRNTESWVDPGVGLKGRAPLGTSGLYFEGGVGFGGFGVGSDLFYEINANVGYQWTPSIGTTLGYRMFDVDYENNGFVYNVRQQGWQLGLTWTF
jgi:hypothetical protein